MSIWLVQERAAKGIFQRQQFGDDVVAEGLIWKGRYREVSSVMRNPASRSQKAFSNSTLPYTSKDA